MISKTNKSRRPFSPVRSDAYRTDEENKKIASSEDRTDDTDVCEEQYHVVYPVKPELPKWDFDKDFDVF